MRLKIFLVVDHDPSFNLVHIVLTQRLEYEENAAEICALFTSRLLLLSLYRKCSSSSCNKEGLVEKKSVHSVEIHFVSLKSTCPPTATVWMS